MPEAGTGGALRTTGFEGFYRTEYPVLVRIAAGILSLTLLLSTRLSAMATGVVAIALFGSA